MPIRSNWYGSFHRSNKELSRSNLGNVFAQAILRQFPTIQKQINRFMGISVFLRFAGICVIFGLLSPVLPSLAFKPRLRNRRFAVRILLELLIGDVVMAVLMLILSLFHLAGPVSVPISLIVFYTAAALWSYKRKPWIIFTQFTKYSRRILLGLLGWKVIFRNLFHWIHDRLFLADSFGDRVLRRHRTQWILTICVLAGSAGLFYYRQAGVRGFTDPYLKVLLEHCVMVFRFHPFGGSAGSFFPALMCGFAAYLSHIEAYAVIRTFPCVMTLQGVAAVTALLLIVCSRLHRRIHFLPILAGGALGTLFLLRFPVQTMQVPDNDTAEAMLTIRSSNIDHTWTMIAVDDSLGIARGYGIYYAAEDLFDDMGSGNGEDTDDLLSERAEDIFLNTDKIYVCVDHVIPSEDSVLRSEQKELSDRLDQWAEMLADVYPQNVEILSDSADCTLYRIRQNPAAPLNLNVGMDREGGT